MTSFLPPPPPPPERLVTNDTVKDLRRLAQSQRELAAYLRDGPLKVIAGGADPDGDAARLETFVQHWRSNAKTIEAIAAAWESRLNGPTQQGPIVCGIEATRVADGEGTDSLLVQFSTRDEQASASYSLDIVGGERIDHQATAIPATSHSFESRRVPSNADVVAHVTATAKGTTFYDLLIKPTGETNA
jgi:hypothetical protein